MDTLELFEQKLKTDNQPLKTAEQNWDQRAETFYYNQVNGSTYYNHAVPDLLEEKGILTPSSSILDIGAGSGRYSIPLAKRGQSVQALDLSSEMLQYLQQEIEKNSINNIKTMKSAWPTTEETGEFDIAFAAMCPATRSVEALEAMSKTARKYGVICQFTQSTDSVIETLKNHQLMDEESTTSPHNDRDILQAYFNVLWELGYQPEIAYLHDTFEVTQTLNEALDIYKQRYEHIDSEQLKNALASIQQDGQIKNMKYTTLAIISWKTGKKSNKCSTP